MQFFGTIFYLQQNESQVVLQFSDIEDDKLIILVQKENVKKMTPLQKVFII